MIPTVKLTLEIPVHYLPELEPIFRDAERHHIGHFRGLVASVLANTIQQVLAQHELLKEELANGKGD